MAKRKKKSTSSAAIGCFVGMFVFFGLLAQCPKPQSIKSEPVAAQRPTAPPDIQLSEKAALARHEPGRAPTPDGQVRAIRRADGSIVFEGVGQPSGRDDSLSNMSVSGPSESRAAGDVYYDANVNRYRDSSGRFTKAPH